MKKFSTDGAKLDLSNIANYGSEEHKNLKGLAAKSEAEWKGCGKEPGIEIWRVENSKDNFGIKKWPKKQYGKFFNGDSYIVLHTYKVANRLAYDVYFWLGSQTTRDEAGVAAYKTVELDDLLGDLPVQHREVEGHESKSFMDIFNNQIRILAGGIDSGFNMVKPEEYMPVLLHCKGKRDIRVTEVPLKVESLNDGDVFLLDAGLKIFQWNGTTAGVFEKRKATELIRNLKERRNGRPTSIILDGLEEDDEFWGFFGGKPASLNPADEDDEEVKATELTLLRLSDASGSVEMTEVASGEGCTKSKLDSADVFLLDTGVEIFVWVGAGASKAERSSALRVAGQYLQKTEKPAHTPICRQIDGRESKEFKELLKF